MRVDPDAIQKSQSLKDSGFFVFESVMQVSALPARNPDAESELGMRSQHHAGG